MRSTLIEWSEVIVHVRAFMIGGLWVLFVNCNLVHMQGIELERERHRKRERV